MRDPRGAGKPWSGLRPPAEFLREELDLAGKNSACIDLGSGPANPPGPETVRSSLHRRRIPPNMPVETAEKIQEKQKKSGFFPKYDVEETEKELRENLSEAGIDRYELTHWTCETPTVRRLSEPQQIGRTRRNYSLHGYIA